MAIKLADAAIGKEHYVPKKSGGALDKIKASKHKLDATTREQKKLLKEAKNELSAVTKKHEKQIKECRDQIEKAWDDVSGHVKTVGGIALYGDQIIADKKTIPLSVDMEIEVHSGGNVYSETTVKGGGTSITGAVIGGAIAGPVGAVVGGRKGVKSKSEVQDERKLFVSIVSGGDNAVVELDPKFELDARKLVAEAKSQASTLEARKRTADEKVAELSARLHDLEEDTSEIDMAKKRCDEQERLTEKAIKEARAAHKALKNSFDPQQITEEKKARRSESVSKTLMVCGLVFGALFALLGINEMTSVPDGAVAGVILLLLADLLLVKATKALRDRKALETDGE